MWKRMKKKIPRRKEKWTKKISHLSVVVLMRSKLWGFWQRVSIVAEFIS